MNDQSDWPSMSELSAVAGHCLDNIRTIQSDVFRFSNQFNCDFSSFELMRKEGLCFATSVYIGRKLSSTEVNSSEEMDKLLDDIVYACCNQHELLYAPPQDISQFHQGTVNVQNIRDALDLPEKFRSQSQLARYSNASDVARDVLKCDTLLKSRYNLAETNYFRDLEVLLSEFETKWKSCTTLVHRNDRFKFIRAFLNDFQNTDWMSAVNALLRNGVYMSYQNKVDGLVRLAEQLNVTPPEQDEDPKGLPEEPNFFRAVQSGDWFSVRRHLCRAPGKLKEEKSLGEFALHLAAESAANKVLQIIFSLKPPGLENQLNLPSVYGTPLLHASKNGHVETQKFLWEQGANATTVGKDKKTGLHAAAENGKKESVQFFLQNCLPQEPELINLRDKEGQTALFIAAEKNYAEIVRLLLEAGADSSISNNTGKTPVQVAEKHGNREALRELSTPKADSATAAPGTDDLEKDCPDLDS